MRKTSSDRSSTISSRLDRFAPRRVFKRPLRNARSSRFRRDRCSTAFKGDDVLVPDMILLIDTSNLRLSRALTNQFILLSQNNQRNESELTLENSRIGSRKFQS